MTTLRLLRLAVTVARRASVRTALLGLLVSIGLSVFLGVQALSFGSTQSLDEAVAQDSGVTGSYSISIQGVGSEVPSTDVAKVFDQIVSGLPVRVVDAYDIFTGQDLNCVKNGPITQAPLAVLVKHRGQQLPWLTQRDQFATDAACLGGLVLPGDVVSRASVTQKRTWSDTTFLDVAYARVLSLQSWTVERRALVTFAPSTDYSNELNSRAGAAVRGAFPWIDPRSVSVTVTRLDSDSATRRASEGVKLVYNLIGWGVLTLVGLGILVSELVIIKDRSWFFGLSRAMGARSHQITVLVAGDVVVVVGLGAAVALATCALLQPVITEFGRTAFGVPLIMLESHTVLPLLVGVAMLLLIAASYPIFRVLRLDPLDVLER